MKHAAYAIAVLSTFLFYLYVADPEGKFRHALPSDAVAELASLETESSAEVVAFAAGTIQGSTETIDLSLQIVERIDHIAVKLGQWVQRHDTLVELDGRRYQGHVDLAVARRSSALAKRDRLISGARADEINAAQQLLRAAQSELDGSKRQRERMTRLHGQNAASAHDLDQIVTRCDVLASRLHSIAAELKLLTDPPREEDLRIVQSEVDAAEAELVLARVNLQHCTLTAPSEGRVLEISQQVGELAQPDSLTPLMRISDTRQLRVLAEVDEYDAIRVQPGMRCRIHCDAQSTPLTWGIVSLLEPTMRNKSTFSERAGERRDAHVQRVWIELEEGPELPIGLSVDVYIFRQTDQSSQLRAQRTVAGTAAIAPKRE